MCSSDSYELFSPDTLGQNPPVYGYKWTPEVNKSYRNVRCKSCSHVYSSPRLLDMYKYYQDVADNSYLENEGLRVETARKVLRKIRKYMSSGRMLDIGCATGDFLTAASEYYEVEGLELSHWAFEIAKSRDLAIYSMTVGNLAEEKQNVYDVVTMWGGYRTFGIS